MLFSWLVLAIASLASALPSNIHEHASHVLDQGEVTASQNAPACPDWPCYTKGRTWSNDWTTKCRRFPKCKTCDECKLQSPPDSAYVQKDDIPSDIGDEITGYCQVKFGTCPGLEWHLLGDPQKGQMPDPTWVVAHPDQMSWSGLEHPTVTETESQVSCDNSDNSAEFVCTATISVEEGTAMTTSTEVASKVGVEFSVSASIPGALKVGGKTSFEVSTTDTTEKEVSQAVTSELSAEVTVQPHERKCVYVTQKTSTFESTWTLPMSITDRGGKGIRCQYSEPCNDHYFWYTNIDGAIPTEYTMSGTSTANLMSHGTVKVRDGPCTSPNATKVLP